MLWLYKLERSSWTGVISDNVAGRHQPSVVYHFLAIAGAVDSGIPITQGTLSQAGVQRALILPGDHMSYSTMLRH